MARHFIVTADGGSRGNPGAAAYGAVIYENDKVVKEIGAAIGEASNNVAEYSGLIAGLKGVNEIDPAATNEINSVISAKQKDRGVVAGKIEKALLDLYEKIRASSGIGAAALIGNKCNGCNLAINAVEMQRIKTLPADEVLRCEECRRILVRI